MSVMVERVKPTAQRGWQSALLPAVLSIPALIRGVDRIGEGHPLSGWLFVAGGALLLGSAAWFWLSRARAQ